MGQEVPCGLVSGFQAFTVLTPVQSLVRELRPRRPCSVAKKKREEWEKENVGHPCGGLFFSRARE